MSDYSAVAPPQQNFNQSSAFAAALQRAKQIAAKINPNATNSGEARQKRPLEEGADGDLEPEPKKGPPAVGPPPSQSRPQNQDGMGAPPMSGGPPQFSDNKQNNQGGLRMNTMNNMGGPGGRNTLEIMIPGPKVGLIIGKGGETIKQLQEKSGAKMVVIQDGPNQEIEKPLLISGDAHKVEYAKQLVYDLIAEKEMKSFNRRGGGRNDTRQQDQYGDFGGGNDSEVLVPRVAVGVVIGKGGDMIKKIQSETGARVQFQQARDEGPGDRRCFLSGNPKQVEMARQRIEELIDSVMQRDGGNDGGLGGGPPRGGPGGPMRGGMRGGRGGGPGGGGDRYDRNGGGGQWEDRRGGGGPPPHHHGGHHGGHQDIVTFSVPANKCGVIIGRGGETIKQINQQSGAYCELDRRNQNPNSNEKYFTIKGDPDQIESAKRIISDKIQMPISFLPTGGPPMANNMPTAYPGMAPQAYNPQGNWGVPGGYQQQQWGGQSQVNDPSAQQSQVQMGSSSSQPDYSLQWAEYYRSLGMHREAEMIEQQAKAKAAVATGAPGAAAAQAGAPPNPAATSQMGGAAAAAAPQAQADYSAQWAEYYRSIGKIKEAEAIEQQMKSKTGGTQATGAAGTSAGGPSPAQASTGSYQQQQQQPYGGYQAPGGYYPGQPQGPGGVPQGGYGFPGYNYGAQQGGAGANSQEN